MAATKNVPHRAQFRKSITTIRSPRYLGGGAPSEIKPRHGVVTLFGYGIRVWIDRGHLILEDGIGDERREGRFPRVNHGLQRVVVVGSDGMVSLAALRWLADQDAAFVMLERDGSVLAVTGPVSSSDARLRRAQSHADQSGVGLLIARALISQKLAGQERLAREALRDSAAAETIAAFRAQLPTATTIEAVRQIEAQAAKAYWSGWHDLPLSFPRSDLPRVPDHWRTFDARKSPLTGSPRSATNPLNAMLNYLYAILGAETRLAVAAMGLDPGLGFLHFDRDARDSVACDLMEPVRPHVDAFVLDWMRRALLKREWFFEQRDGTCRLMASFAAQLAETAPTWRRAVAPLAEWLTHTLWLSIGKPASEPGLATRLTQRHNREAQGGPSMPPPAHPIQPQSLCHTCGKPIKRGRQRCSACSDVIATERIVKVAPSGWIATHTPTAQTLRADTQRRHAAARRAWDPATHPSWLNQQQYLQKIQPLLMGLSTSAIASTLGVTWAYASNIRKGKRLPHPRHWLTLAGLVGVSSGE